MKKYNTEMNYDIRLQKFIADAAVKEDTDALKRVMNTKEGRWLFCRILEMTGYKGQSFTGNSQTYFYEGMREIGIRLDRMLMNLLGKEGFDLKQKAERENIEFQYRQKKFFDKEENDG